MTVAEGKHKKPPTFHYLPKNRAKKLKRSWVDNKKLKTQWKAQKKRQGLSEDKPSSHCEVPSEDASDVHASSEVRDSTPVHTEPPLASSPPTSKTSLRDLTRQAYSRSTLHTHKSGPLRKQRGPNVPFSRERSKDNQVNKPSHRPNGQPDMKLRMNAMLEKIKRDLC
ncbi:hypothetical protein SCLCIDRAFT_25290 [Scleroderma citrinum Foug A]|uniref:rRNA-processing protein FYV7 n=1 Tax=Scleroderma citrinum Foug A TaxID=1036808 RepID=A0A0C3E0P5_9AGAM|nr:hypothetical protein SCLCIDRAFT_25290 [Scleroderma citrinum Foug A]